jgi:hypothetical protein
MKLLPNERGRGVKFDDTSSNGSEFSVIVSCIDQNVNSFIFNNIKSI